MCQTLDENSKRKILCINTGNLSASVRVSKSGVGGLGGWAKELEVRVEILETLYSKEIKAYSAMLGIIVK